MKATEILVELKVLTKRITTAINNIQPISYTNGGVLVSAEKDKEKFKANAKSSMDSINGLITRRTALKSALVLSNATTNVTINGVVMTVAAAIERKDSIESERMYLNKLVEHYNSATRNVESMTQQAQREVDEQIKAMGAVGAELIVETRKKLIEQRKVELYDPHGALGVIEKLRENIEKFEADVDTHLSISNAVTEIAAD